MRLCYSIVMSMALIMLVTGAGVISGCGKKGALYIPSEPQQQAARKKAQAEQRQKASSTTTPKP